MAESTKTLLALVEFLGHAQLRSVYEQLGYDVHLEFTARKAISWLRKGQPDVIVADFYHQPDFRDRVSNLESLMASAQGLAVKPRILIFHDPGHAEALAKMQQRFHVDVAFTTPVDQTLLRQTLSEWRTPPG